MHTPYLFLFKVWCKTCHAATWHLLNDDGEPACLECRVAGTLPPQITEFIDHMHPLT